ncbi:magnesium transporter [Desulfovibrio litoralis]|uniref:Magnesium transporter MgtE n=1 Tax=Desulfovibrio litoralis DSM 11393 TaxID=1121455 RepID=A0A1M7RXG5_9BACT|nr:magnesium transporter [Desulfovibrio litoralis]SHN50999.1 magnesium transporter [Desulfovibrio litoralis DSM 11393]
MADLNNIPNEEKNKVIPKTQNYSSSDCLQEFNDVSEIEYSHAADLAEHLETLSLEKQLCLLTRLPVSEAAEAVAELEEHARIDILENIDPDLAASLLSEMSPDDAADVLDELEEAHRDHILDNIDADDAEDIRHLMAFDPDTAGGIMNIEILILEDYINVDDAITKMRSEIEDKEVPYYGYVVDESDKLVGVISLRELLVAKHGTLIKDIIKEQNLITVTFDVAKEEVAKLLSHYNFMAMPVVDKEGRLMGVITHDDIIDVITELASEDLLSMVGAGYSESVDTPWKESVKMRLPWLMMNMITSSVSAYVVYLFDGTIAQMALLAVLMPMVANQAGNTGQQALAVMIRELATTRFETKRAWFAVLREGKIGFSSGMILGFVISFVVGFIFSNYALGFVMGAALILDMLLGALAGASIPLILKSLGRDPAQASSIFLTMITDSAGFFVFLGFASLFLLS